MAKRIKIFDTTLRDGEQSPGCSMNVEEKLEMARQLERLNVDIIEAGFAIASQGDFEAIRQISRLVRGPIICSLSRANKKDIERSAEAIKEAERGRIHTFIATSPVHMTYKLKKSPEEVLRIAVEAVTHARQFCGDVEFSAEDAGRSDIDFLCRIFEAVIKAGATTINIPDTVGYTVPQEWGEKIRILIERTVGMDKVDVSVHCHNDLGLAVANSLAAVMSGATQVECTVNGIGERAGNASLEEIVMALKTRRDFFGFETGVRTTEILRSSLLLTRITGVSVQPNKAVVGANAFAHEAGIHQDGVLKEKLTYEIMDAKSVGFVDSSLVLGKHSGRHAFGNKLKEMGITLGPDALEKAFQRFKDLADSKKDVTDSDIYSIMKDEISLVPEIYKLKAVHATAGTVEKSRAEVWLIHEGKEITKAGSGDGPVDSVYIAIDEIVGEKITLHDYAIRAVTPGTDAIGEVVVHINDHGTIFSGHGAHTDIVVSSAKAYVNAINKMLGARKDAGQKQPREVGP